MRKSTQGLLATGLCLTLASGVQAEEQNGRVYYKDGLKIEAGDSDLKLNTQLQPRFEFTDADRDIDPDADNTAGFRMRRARLIASGNLLNKSWSYYLNNDFAAKSGGGDLRYAWLQYNGKVANVRAGQFKVPYSRQTIISSTALFFADRALANEAFTFDRENGAMVHGNVGETGHYYVGVFNGRSDGELDSRAPVDTSMQGAAAVDFSTPEYGNRGQEGDLREKGDFGMTAGASAVYGQGSGVAGEEVGADGAVVEISDDFDTLALNGDLGFRCHGSDIQAEVYYRGTELDTIDADTDEVGYYVQATHNLDKNWGFGGRYGWQDPDDGSTDDITEYTLGLTYFIDGHRLKIQNQVTFEVDSPAGGGEDEETFKYILSLAALI